MSERGKAFQPGDRVTLTDWVPDLLPEFTDWLIGRSGTVASIEVSSTDPHHLDYYVHFDEREGDDPDDFPPPYELWCSEAILVREETLDDAVAEAVESIARTARGET